MGTRPFLPGALALWHQSTESPVPGLSPPPLPPVSSSLLSLTLPMFSVSMCNGGFLTVRTNQSLNKGLLDEVCVERKLWLLGGIRLDEGVLEAGTQVLVT